MSQRGESRAAVLRPGSGGRVQLPGTDPAIGGGYVAVLDGGTVVLLGRESLNEVDRVDVPGVDAVAVSRSWLAVRSRLERRDRLEARPIAPDGTIGAATQIAAAGPPAQIGRPSLGGERLAYAVAKDKRNKIVIFSLGQTGRRTVIASRKKGLSNPSLHGQSMLYVRSKRRRDQLRLRKLGKGGDRGLDSAKRMWSTELTGRRAYVTLLEGREPRSRIVSVRR